MIYTRCKKLFLLFSDNNRPNTPANYTRYCQLQYTICFFLIHISPSYLYFFVNNYLTLNFRPLVPIIGCINVTCSCPQTCEAVASGSDTCSHSECQPGCQCPSGSVVKDDLCVEQSTCPCYHEGKIYKVNQLRNVLHSIEYILYTVVDFSLSTVHLKGELRSKIFLLPMKVLTLIKAKSNVFF